MLPLRFRFPYYKAMSKLGQARHFRHGPARLRFPTYCDRESRHRRMSLVGRITQTAIRFGRAPAAATGLFSMLPYMRRRQRLSTAKSLGESPALASASMARASGMRRATSALPFAESATTTSRLLLAERVRVTKPRRQPRDDP